MKAASQGRLLVAAPALADPNFSRTVVLLLGHGDDGAVGVVLNRPGDVAVETAFWEWAGLAGDRRVFFVGGPVAPASVIALARVADGGGGPAWTEVVGDLGMVDLGGDRSLAGEVRQARFFMGYAGWGPGQLEAEIDSGAWFVVDAEPDDAMSERPDDLWSDVLRRQPGPLAMLSRYPAHLERN